MPHVDPLDRADLPQFEEKFARYDAIRGFLPNSILTMARRPNIAKAFMDLNQAILYEGTVPEDLKMMVALMTSMATGCRYCQGHMANLSHVYDVSDEKIAAVWECETSPLFTEAEKAALVLAREAAGVPNDVTEAHFAALKPHFNDAEIVEIVASIALFGYLNRWNDTMATTMEAHPAAVAKKAMPAWDEGKHGASE
ncbi:carboxymuconolactone decarboxylase family protein [uncultured Roseibium sp.]|uniref:carboxymuconolactone decarboxylase family protein n=1 Tax=uncultured Roseibium sp. TaxID=1936171 RepID=UPI0026114979|nr:carboxymuconolactone decarboxylase family protein [uncultured Roseibium sp.]